MSTDYVYDLDDAEQARPQKSHSLEKGIKWILIVAAFILAAEFIWLFAISPCIPLSTKEVRGFPGFDGIDVLNYAGVNGKSSFVSINTKNIEKALAGHYLVDSVQVSKRFPDRLTISLKPRQAIAVTFAFVEGKQIPVYYDRHGVIFRIGEQYGKEFDMPILSGLIIEEPALGTRLPAVIGPLLEEFAKINANAPGLLGAISEIQVNRKAYNGFDLLLYPLHYPVRVRLGNNFNEETLRFVLLMLDVFGARGTWPHEIDFRSGIGTYSIKEASYGN